MDTGCAGQREIPTRSAQTSPGMRARAETGVMKESRRWPRGVPGGKNLLRAGGAHAYSKPDGEAAVRLVGALRVVPGPPLVVTPGSGSAGPGGSGRGWAADAGRRAAGSGRGPTSTRTKPARAGPGYSQQEAHVGRGAGCRLGGCEASERRRPGKGRKCKRNRRQGRGEGGAET